MKSETSEKLKVIAAIEDAFVARPLDTASAFDEYGATYLDAVFAD